MDVRLLAYGGEEEVGTSLETTSGRQSFRPATAQAGYQMRRALDVQAKAVAAAIMEPRDD